MKESPNRALVAMAIIGCFALAFGGTLFIEDLFVWLVAARFRMSTVEAAVAVAFAWRMVASLAVAILLCIWLARR